MSTSDPRHARRPPAPRSAGETRLQGSFRSGGMTDKVTVIVSCCVALLVTSLANGAAGFSVPEGQLQSCVNEGQRVEVGIVDDPCITCRCVGGSVTCDQEPCPATKSCHLVLLGKKIHPDSCCEQCKGCQTAEGTFSEGQQWPERDEPCVVNTCSSGVITRANVKCHTPCSSPLPAAPGQCCPRCPSCQLPGLATRPGHNVTSPGDPCVTCSCGQDGSQSCRRVTCPALSCPASETTTDPGHCCPRCTGKLRVAADAAVCRMGKSNYTSGAQFQLDPCTACTCEGSTSVCRRQSCPDLACPRRLQVHSPDRCCPVCRAPERVRRVCRRGPRRYQDGDTWRMGPCVQCSCTDGQIACEAERCAAELSCPPGQHAATPPGQCCPQCVEDDAVCTVFGDPHYSTFDGRIYNYQGTCKYQLAKDCADKTFSIRVHNSARKSRFFSWTQSATIKVGELRIALRQRKQVKVNRKKVTLPHVDLDHHVTVLQDKTDNYNVLVKLTGIGVSVVWDGDSFLQVKVPPSYKTKMCGLCGNYNGNKTDDFSTRRGRLAKLTRQFARSWTVGGRSQCRSHSRRRSHRRRKRPPSACGGDREARTLAVRQCNRLKSALFADCHRQVHPATYFKSCVQDMCECQKKKPCYCEALTAYSHACQTKGVTVDWINGTGCATDPGAEQCPRGARPVRCKSSCQPTCAMPELSSKKCPADTGTCQPGCVCKKGRLLHEGACVPVHRCPER